MDIIGSLIYVILIIVLLGAIAVVSYVSYDYFNYKNDNTLKLSNVINNTDNNKNDIIDITKNTSNLDVSFQSLNKDIINKNLLIDTIDTTVKSNTSNITTFDSGLKNFFTFSNDSSNINSGLFEYYMFSAEKKKSLDLISKTTAVAGMTINTNNDDTSSFEICNSDNKLNCIKMKNSGNNFVISPSNEHTSNILFKNKTDQTVLNVDLINNTTYFNTDGNNESVMYVNNDGLHLNKPMFTKSNIQLLNADSELEPAIITYGNYGTLLNPAGATPAAGGAGVTPAAGATPGAGATPAGGGATPATTGA